MKRSLTCILRIILLSITLLFFHGWLVSQENSFFNRPPDSVTVSDRWSVYASVLPYFKNNEYFHGIFPGFTALGTISEVGFRYREGRHSLQAGVIYTFAYGHPLRSLWLPVISFQYGFSEQFSLVLGTLDRPVEHSLPREIYSLDQFLYRPVEYGVQFLWNGKKIRADTWIDWRQNIRPGDQFQEKFVQGNRLSYHMLHNEVHSLEVPLGLLFYHAGGQLDSIGNDNVTRLNYYSGINYRRHFPLHRSVNISLLFAGFKNAESDQVIPWQNGNVLSLRAGFLYRAFSFAGGYHKVHKYFAPLGDPFFSLHNLESGKSDLLTKNMVSARLEFVPYATEHFKLLLQGEFYKTFKKPDPDYNYGIFGRFLF